MKEGFRTKWSLPFLIVFLLIMILSLRILSDPDMGTHLKAGKWIIDNHAFPQKDTFTYTVNNHDYIDVHWLFQVIIFIVYRITGYNGLSVLVSLITLLLLILLMQRIRLFEIPLPVSCFVFLIGFLVMDPRIMLRPEMFTFIYITIILLVLDQYYHQHKNHLWLLPFIMLLWCNTQGLFVLGFLLTGAYLVSLFVRDRKPDRKYLFWMIASIIVCLINPYFIKGFIFPLELFTRFDKENIFHNHVKELTTFFLIDNLVIKDVLFLIFTIFLVLLSLVTWKKRPIHELILVVVFGYLAFVGIRNIALFAVVSMPVLACTIRDLHENFKRDKYAKFQHQNYRWIGWTAYFLLITVSVGLICRILTNSYYVSNNSYNRTGIGLDENHQPENAAEFLLKNKLDGKIINGLSFGAWLSWKLPQPVFIDGRLEVIGENLYNEVVESWNGGLSGLIMKYKPELIIYNYEKYYPWTIQLASMPDWRLIYLDGFSAIFAFRDYSPGQSSIKFASLPAAYNIPYLRNSKEIPGILNSPATGKFAAFIRGFYEQQDDKEQRLLNLASFCLQMKNPRTAEVFFLEILKNSPGRYPFIYYALADIYKNREDKDNVRICYNHILMFDPTNDAVKIFLKELDREPVISRKVPESWPGENDAVFYFNRGNKKYQSGDIDGALNDYQKAIGYKPDYYKAYNNRGIIFAAEKKDYRQAIIEFDQAIKINPGYADAYLGRGTSRKSLDDPDGACSDWQKAKSLGNLQAGHLIELYCGKK